jgi:hypothetical protein
MQEHIEAIEPEVIELAEGNLGEVAGGAATTIDPDGRQGA